MILYDLCYAFCRYILILFSYLGFGSKKLKRGLLLRRDTPWLKLKSKNVVWIHCSSGEIEYAKPVIRQLKEKGETVLVTFFSPSVEPILKRDSFIDEYCICPWDDRPSLNGLIKTVQPKALLVARTDIWPRMLTQCRQHGIPTHLFSLTISSSNSRLKFPARFFFRYAFELFDSIHCVSLDDQENLSRISNQLNSSVCGDTRYDQVQYRLSHPNAQVQQFQSERPTLILGSIWHKDFDVLLSSLKELAKSHRLIFAPHEPEGDFLALISQNFPGSEKLSNATQTNDWNVLIIDSVGVLADFYKIADFAFIGGSFVSQVHSVMEALAAGCLTYVGPMFENNREAIEFSQHQIGSVSPVQVIRSGNDLLHSISGISDVKTIGEQIRSEIAKRGSASQKLIQTFEKFQSP